VAEILLEKFQMWSMSLEKKISPKIIPKLFQRLTAAHEYFPTRSMSLRQFWNNFSGWDTFEKISDVVTCEI